MGKGEKRLFWFLGVLQRISTNHTGSLELHQLRAILIPSLTSPSFISHHTQGHPFHPFHDLNIHSPFFSLQALEKQLPTNIQNNLKRHFSVKKRHLISQHCLARASLCFSLKPTFVVIAFICICFLFSSQIYESQRISYLYLMSKKCLLIDWIPQVPPRKVL